MIEYHYKLKGEIAMRYKVAQTDILDPDLNSSEWARAETGYIGVNRWKEYSHAPITSFKMLRGPEGISVLFDTEEKNLRCQVKEENGDVYTDSCVEFFFKPDIYDVRYLNFELNPKGVLHLGIGEGRHGRRLLDTDRALFSIVSDAKEGDWRLKLYIPDSFIFGLFEKISPVCKGNFYKGGEMTDHVHFGAWSEVETENPDFHVPDFFGKIKF